MDELTLHDLTPAYALDALDPDDERAYEEHLARCERCREELVGLREAAASLAYAAGPSEPPPALRGRILEAARSERPNVVTLRPRWAYPVAAVAAVAACVALGLGIWAASLHSKLSSQQQALRSAPLSGAAGSVVVGGGDQGALVVSGLKPAPAGRTYQAWVIQDGKAYPAGTFDAETGTVTVRLEHAVPPGAVIAITIERAGGATAPTMKPIVSSAPV
jgi:anti-sigma factor RsiW